MLFIICKCYTFIILNRDTKLFPPLGSYVGLRKAYKLCLNLRTDNTNCMGSCILAHQQKGIEAIAGMAFSEFFQKTSSHQ